MNIRDKFVGALVGTGVGDALGSHFEGWSFSSTIELSLEDILSRYSGIYTDDTEMMIVLAESIVKEKGLKASTFIKELAARFNPGRGYGYGTSTVLKMVRKGADWREAAHIVFESGFYGNGGCIRVAPVSLAYYDDEKLLLKAAEYSCIVTHSHPLAVEGCRLQAYAIGLALKGLDRRDILKALLKLAESEVYSRKLSSIEELLRKGASLGEAVHTLKNWGSAPDSVPLALYLFLNSEDFESAVIDAVRCGGDTDSIAAMVGAIAGAYYGSNNIPLNLAEKLEDVNKITGLADSIWRLKIEKKIKEPIV